MKRYGIAIDIGTTTVTAGLIDLAARKEAASFIQANPQARFGDDVISRLAFCAKHKTAAAQLHKAIINCINAAVRNLARQAGAKRSDIQKAVVVGNTAMEHFFLRIPADRLGRAPYVSDLAKGIIETTAGKTGLALDKSAKIYLLPVVKSFVGSDLTAGVLYTRIFGPHTGVSKKAVNMLVDIGTNGEIALVKDKKIFVASTAAGPAFETPDKGISGSGLIETVSGMLKKGVIEKSGRLLDASGSKITQEDIRKAQLAKAAIMAGMLALIKKAGVGLKDIENLYVAGKFGNYIDKEAAINMGLLPRIGVKRIKFVSNAAYKGAALALCSKSAMKKSEGIAKKAIHVSLFGHREFKEEFIKNIGF